MSKLETQVVQGNTVAPAKPQRGPTTEDPRDEWGFLEEVIRNLKPVNGKVTTIPVPLQAIVGADALDDLKYSLLDAEGGPVEIEVLSVHGRCVQARSVRGLFPPWAHLASVLLGTGAPCDDFRIADGRLYASLKTCQQQEADKSARSLDELFRAQLPRFDNKWDAAGLYCATCDALDGATAAPAKAVARSKKKKKIPEGMAQYVMRVMQRDWPEGAAEIEELVVAVEQTTPPKLDGAGKNRTARYAREAIDKLISRDILYLHNASQVSLHEE